MEARYHIIQKPKRNLNTSKTASQRHRKRLAAIVPCVTCGTGFRASCVTPGRERIS